MEVNYSKMVEYNKGISAEKEETAISVINQMLQSNQQISATELAKRTQFSRTFFYNNERVRAELDRARDLQSGKEFARAKKVALDKSMEKQIEILQRQIIKLREENTELKVENQKLSNALKKQDIIFLRSL